MSMKLRSLKIIQQKRISHGSAFHLMLFGSQKKYDQLQYEGIPYILRRFSIVGANMSRLFRSILCRPSYSFSPLVFIGDHQIAGVRGFSFAHSGELSIFVMHWFQNGVEQRVTQQRFSSANRTQNAGRTSGEDQVNQKEKQRLSDGANSSGPTVERSTFTFRFYACLCGLSVCIWSNGAPWNLKSTIIPKGDFSYYTNFHA